MVDAWTKAQTISTFISLGAILIAAFALVVDRIRLVHKRDEHLKATDPKKMRYFYTHRLGWWQTLFGEQSPVLNVTRISGLIEAGDRGFWTSAALDRILDGHAEITWVPLFASIFEEVWHSKVAPWPGLWGDEYKIAMNRIRDSSNQKQIQHKQMRWKHYETKKDGTCRLVNCCRPLEPIDTDTPLKASVIAEEKSAELHHRGLGNTRPTWNLNRKPCIETTREELIALALIMGSSIKIQSYTESLNGVGAFGLSLYAIPDRGSWTLGLTQGSRIPRHVPSMGSGYTTLMAKHLACGSVPFAQNSGWIKSVYVKKPVLQAILCGDNIKDISAYGGPSLELLRMLPGEKEIDAYYGVAEAEEKPAHPGVGLILREYKKHTSGWEEVGDWPRAVTGIAFGGLVPQVYPNVARAVQFTTWGRGDGGNGKVIQELERLVDMLHEREHSKIPAITRHDTNINPNVKPPEEKICERCLFGEYVRERCEARKLVDYVNYTVPWQHSSPRTAAAVFARYSNLLEHVITLCRPTLDASSKSVSSMSQASTPQTETLPLTQALTAPPVLQRPVKSATSYTPHNISQPNPAAKIKHYRTFLDGTTQAKAQAQAQAPTVTVDALFECTYDILRSVYAARFAKNLLPKIDLSSNLIYTEDLGDTLATIIDKRIPEGPRVEKPFSLLEGAFIVRCILAAWSWQVPHIVLIEPAAEDEEDSIVEEKKESWGKQRSRIASIDELPPVLVFG
jgi:hypothetical protein